MKLYLLSTRAVAKGRWNRLPHTAALARRDCLSRLFGADRDPEIPFRRESDANRARLLVYDVQDGCPTVIRRRSRGVVAEHLLQDFTTTLRQVAYDQKWHLVRGKRMVRITPGRAAALLGSFNRWMDRTGGRPPTKFLIRL